MTRWNYMNIKLRDSKRNVSFKMFTSNQYINDFLLFLSKNYNLTALKR